MQSRILLFLLFFAWLNFSGFAQTIIVKGKVTDAENGDPIPFANLLVKGTRIGTVCDFDGNYTLRITGNHDSLSAIYIGYRMRTKKLPPAGGILNFQLGEAGIQLSEVVIKPGENPAWPILRKVIEHKQFNDKRGLISYEYEAYNKLEVDIDKLSDKFKKKKIIRKIQNVLDSMGKVAGEDGKPILPFFISETISKYYYNKSPNLRKEQIERTKISGIGVNEGEFVSQIIGSSFQEYNFYENWLRILGKEFVSPIADGWKMYYEYLLEDSNFVNGDWIYRIEVTPKRPQDLAFRGSIWINRSDYALVRLDLVVNKEANLNFIDKIKFQQELTRSAAGAYLPLKNRITVDIANLNKNWAGMIAKSYTSAKNIIVNRPMDESFFQKTIEVMDDYRKTDDNYWETHRHDTLSLTEKNIFRMIDTVKKIPIVKTYVEIVNIVVNGHKRIGNIDYGPYLLTYGWNNVEGNRFRLGFRTNPDWSRSYLLSGYLAYGTRDELFKYALNADWIMSRNRWTVLGVGYSYDLEQLALMDNSLVNNNLFAAFTRIGPIDRTRPFYSQRYFMNLEREVKKGFRINLRASHWSFDPNLASYNFAYYLNPQEVADGGVPVLKSRFETTEFTGELRWGKDEVMVENRNKRVSVGAKRWPILTFRYTRGVKGILSSDLNYDKFQFSAVQFLRCGILGTGKISLVAGLTPSTVPYPILKAHLGNQTIFMNMSAFNMMQFFEFVSDRFVSVNYQHNFEGLGLNSIPLVSKLKLRFVALGNVLMGQVSDRNINLIPSKLSDGRTTAGFTSLRPDLPYAEVGYGVENIFRLFRIDFMHRLTYLSNQGARNFGVKLNVQFKL